MVISGFGYLGQAVLREVAHRHQALPGRPPADVVIRHASKGQVAKLADAFPAIRANCSITYAELPEFSAVGEHTVYVCLDADDDALSEGLAMAHSLVSRRGHVVVCMRESSPFAGVLAARSGLIDDVMGKLSVFGVIEEACVPSNIRDDFTEQLARSIHSAYVAMEAAHGRTPATNPSMVPWESLPEDLRQANIAQAAGIGDKMEAIGAIIVPECAGAPATTSARSTPTCSPGPPSARPVRTRTATRSALCPRPCATRASRSFVSRRTPSRRRQALRLEEPPVRIGEPDRPPDQLSVGRVVVHLLVAEHEGGTA